MKQAQNRHDLAAGIDDKTAVAVHENLDSQRKAPSDRTGKAQSSAASQGKGKGRGENEKALRAFVSGLNNSLRGVELENAQTLKAAVGIAKAWLKDVERKARSAKG